jgi:hypothetical protein
MLFDDVEESKKEKTFFDLIISCLTYFFVHCDNMMDFWYIVVMDWKSCTIASIFICVNFWTIRNICPYIMFNHTVWNNLAFGVCYESMKDLTKDKKLTKLSDF